MTMAMLQSQGQFQGHFFDVLRQFVTSNMTGRLSVRFAESKAQIFIRTGWVIHAELNATQGQEALNQCLEVEFGDYTFDSGLESQTRTITDSFSRIAVQRSRANQTNPFQTAEMTVKITEDSSLKNEQQPINSTILAGLIKVVIEALGPVGNLILEDAASDLGWELVALPQEKLPDLIVALRNQITDTNTLIRLENALRKIGLNEVKS